MRWSHRSERSTDDGTQDQGEARVQANPHEQHDRTAQPRDPQTHARGRLVPGRAERVDAHLRARPLRDLQRVVDAPLPRHVPAR